MQTLVGGFLLLMISGITGEWQHFSFGQVSTAGILSLAYLVIFGSLIAYSAYIWLLQVVAPAHVATYAFVNPVVAVLLGCAVLDEPLNARMLVAAAVVIAGVALITTTPRPAKA
jgi:drug/metabolite transporter (DMT)-like permease